MRFVLVRWGDMELLRGSLRCPVPADDVIQEELFSAPVEIVARPDHPLCSEKNVTLETLQSYPWVVPGRGTPTRAIFESTFTEAGLEVPSRLVETGSQILVRSLLTGSDRLTMISQHQIQHELAMGVFKTVPYEVSHAYRPIGITVRNSWKPTMTQSVFIKKLSDTDHRIDLEDQ